uniref:Zinc finger AN1-type containing 2B n=1 Tax=Sphenodon punctatus TaxID=8508 RepID=A0A8D0HI78_SPHPU
MTPLLFLSADFLPLKCDGCEQIFCTDHITYAQHKCTSAYKKDVQVPVCPLCNTPIPVKRGEMPDVVVGEHIDRDCKSDPAQQKRKIFTNKCLKPGCKQKEMMKVICEQCRGNFCLKHRHPLDHACAGPSGHSSPGLVQAASPSPSWGSLAPEPLPSCQAGSRACSRPSVTGFSQPPLSEEEALQRALEMSLAESAALSSVQPPRYCPGSGAGDGASWDLSTERSWGGKAVCSAPDCDLPD